jgi:predicted nucleotidyltransferase
MQNLDKTEIINFLKSNKAFLREKYGVVSIGLIGSYARNEQKEDSDIDFLVELTEPNFHFLAGLIIYLEENLGKKVDLVRKRDRLRKSFMRRIEKDILYA